MAYFLWHRHENDIYTEKSGISALPSLCRPCCARVETGMGNRNLYDKEGVGGQWNSCVLLGLGNVDCTG